MALNDTLATLKKLFSQVPLHSRERLALKEQLQFSDELTYKVGGTDLWETIPLDPATFKPDGTYTPSWTAFKNGTYAYSFANNSAAYFSFQMPRAYKEGTNIYFNLHLSPANATGGTATWKIDYTWCNINGDFPTATTISKNVTIPNASVGKYLTASFDAISGTGKTLGSLLVAKIYRDDSYGQGVYLLGVSLHYQQDSYGSRTQWAK